MGLCMPTTSGVVVETGSEYMLTHIEPRELDGRLQGGAWVWIIPGICRGDRDRECVCYFVQFDWYWGIVTVLGLNKDRPRSTYPRNVQTNFHLKQSIIQFCFIFEPWKNKSTNQVRKEGKEGVGTRLSSLTALSGWSSWRMYHSSRFTLFGLSQPAIMAGLISIKNCPGMINSKTIGV